MGYDYGMIIDVIFYVITFIVCLMIGLITFLKYRVRKDQEVISIGIASIGIAVLFIWIIYTFEYDDRAILLGIFNIITFSVCFIIGLITLLNYRVRKEKRVILIGIVSIGIAMFFIIIILYSK